MMNPELKRKLSTYTARDHVYETLRERIVTLALEPGRVISEKEISEALQVSRTPVREAFVKLAQEELLEVYPQRGTYVSLIDLRHVEEARFIREHLERAAAREACVAFSEASTADLLRIASEQRVAAERGDDAALFRLDEAFHRAIAVGSGKSRIWTVLEQMNVHLSRIRMLSVTAKADWDAIVAQHERIAEAIRAKDADRADRAMEAHLKKLLFEQDELKLAYPQYFK